MEIAQDSFKIMRKVGEIMGSSDGKGGAGLIIDYGAAKTFDSSFRASRPFRYGGTADLQAFKQHKIVDVFEEPGTADLTANVDFEYLKESLAGSGELAACSRMKDWATHIRHQLARPHSAVHVPAPTGPRG